MPRRATMDERDTRAETALMVHFRDRRGSSEFQALYDRTRASLLSWIAGQVRSRRLPEDPDELLHETFVNIFRYPGGFRDERGASFRVWSRRIATNVVRRASLRRPSRCSLAGFEGDVPEPEDRRSGPGENACAAEESRSLARAWMLLLAFYADAWECLSARERAALELIEVEGRSYAEAAERLRLGRSNMKMIVFRARKRIRAAIGRRMAAAVAPEPD